MYFIHRYAISRLKQAPDEDLMLYLLQLVQALKYENFDEIKEGTLINIECIITFFSKKNCSAGYKQFIPSADSSTFTMNESKAVQSPNASSHLEKRENSTTSLLSTGDFQALYSVLFIVYIFTKHLCSITESPQNFASVSPASDLNASVAVENPLFNSLNASQLNNNGENSDIYG